MSAYSWFLALCLTTGVTSNSEHSTREPVPLPECAELLERIGKEMKANVDKLKLWKGVYRVATVTETEQAIVDGPVDNAGKKLPSRRLNGRFHFHSEDTAEFFLDVPRDCLLSRYTRIGQPFFKALGSGEKISANSTKGHKQWCIFANGRYLEFTPDRRGYVDAEDIELTKAVANSRVVVNEDPAKGLGRVNSSDIVDPRKLYEFGNMPFHEQLKGLAKQMRSGKSDRLAAFQTVGPFGRRIWLEERMGASGEELVTHQLDEAFAFHPTLISLTVPKAITFRTEWSYSQRDGVFVPETWVEEQLRPDGALVRRRNMRLIESEFPRDLSGVTFTAADFNVQDGDLFVDKIEQKAYRFRDGVPVPPADYIRSQRGESNRWLLIASAIGGTVVVALFFVRVWKGHS